MLPSARSKVRLSRAAYSSTTACKRWASRNRRERRRQAACRSKIEVFASLASNTPLSTSGCSRVACDGDRRCASWRCWRGQASPARGRCRSRKSRLAGNTRIAPFHRGWRTTRARLAVGELLELGTGEEARRAARKVSKCPWRAISPRTIERISDSAHESIFLVATCDN